MLRVPWDGNFREVYALVKPSGCTGVCNVLCLTWVISKLSWWMENERNRDVGREEAGQRGAARPLEMLPAMTFSSRTTFLWKQQLNGGTAVWAFCRSVSATSRHLTGWGRAGFIRETLISSMKQRLPAAGWEDWIPDPVYLQVLQHFYHHPQLYMLIFLCENNNKKRFSGTLRLTELHVECTPVTSGKTGKRQKRNPSHLREAREIFMLENDNDRL